MGKPDQRLARVLAKLEAHDDERQRWEGPARSSTLGRIAATHNDPLAFAIVYLRHHLKNLDGDITFSDVHYAWAKSARRWRKPAREPMADRRAEVAPREMGKSTWWFLILPMWAAAHGHVKFAAAFADTDTQAQTHLATFKSELDNNALIRADFPNLVAPKTRGRGTVEADRVSLYHAKSGFVFAAAGMDSSNLGLKVGDKRPDLIILDDIEPHEGRYSAQLATKRLDTLLSAILPLNIRARVVMAGTVTMAGSIIHQVVRWNRGEHDAPGDPNSNAWVGEQNIVARHTPPIITDEHGARRSVWPAKWPLEWLESREHTREYRKNYANDPLAAEGDYWQLEDIERAQALGSTWLPSCTRILVSVDPAVTTKAKSDYTGIAVIAWKPPPRERPKAPGRVVVLEVRQVRKSGEALRRDVLDTVLRHNAGLVLVETNQGGDLWATVLHSLPVKVKSIHQTAKKEERAARWLDHYQRGRVAHAEGAKLAEYEGQLAAFPLAPHDDMVDAAGSGGLYFLDRHRRVRKVEAGGETSPYAA